MTRPKLGDHLIRTSALAPCFNLTPFATHFPPQHLTTSKDIDMPVLYAYHGDIYRIWSFRDTSQPYA